MSSPVQAPPGDASTRERWLRLTLLAACGLSMVVSAPLWMSRRAFPTLPVATWFPALAPPWDLVVFAGVLVSLGAACRFYRPGALCFLAGSLFLALGDQARWQPWFYMYWVMLLLTLAGTGAGTAGCRVALSAVYVWAGIQKLNPDFFRQVVPWFVQPAAGWLPPNLVTVLQWAVAAAPALELFIGLGVWWQRTRRAAVVTAVAVHLLSLLFLGPLGHNQNWVVWPWNLATPALVFILFPREARSWSGLRRCAWALSVVVLFSTLPLLSFFGRWDSYLSFSLYSGHLTIADLFVSATVRDRLPPDVQKFVPPTPTPYNQELQGPYVVRVDLWATQVLRVPPLPEGRNYRHLARYLAGFAADPNEVRLVLIQRVGPTLFYRGGDLRREAGIPLK